MLIVPPGSQRPEHLGPRAKPLSPDEDYQNLAIDREFANDVAIDAGLFLNKAEGPTDLRIIPTGAGYDVRMPVEHLAVLMMTIYVQIATTPQR